jgi:hypothetical protein
MIDAAGQNLTSQQVTKFTHIVTILSRLFVIPSLFSVCPA